MVIDPAKLPKVRTASFHAGAPAPRNVEPMKTRTIYYAVLAIGLIAAGGLAPALVGEAEAAPEICAGTGVNDKDYEACVWVYVGERPSTTPGA